MANDKIIKKLFDHDKQFKKLDNKINGFKREVLDGQDEIITILKRLDQERIFTIERIKRIENDLKIQQKMSKQHESLLKKLKIKLKIA